jgi:adenylate cyclase
MENKGYIDKYIGDCIMAFWNAPLDDPDHAANAVRAAQGMRRRLVELNKQWEKEAIAQGRPHKPLKIGIGVNTGECCVGNMGSNERFNYSVLGDAVNLASRLEGLGKTYGVDFVVGESTVEQLGEWPLLELDLVAVKGKSIPVRIFHLLPSGEEATQVTPEIMEPHQRLLTAYRTQDFQTATRMIAEGVNGVGELSGVYACLQHRIEEFAEAPPPANWDGVYVAKEK